MTYLGYHIKILLFSIVGLTVFLVGCTTYTQQKEIKTQTNSEFAIYLVQGTFISKALVSDINQLFLEETPVLKENEIERYDWNKREFELSTDVISQRLQRKIGLSGKPFVVTVGDERIYVGLFYNPLSSYLPDCPIIHIFPENEAKVYTIIGSESSINKIKDKRIYDALNNAGLLIE